MAEDNKNNPPTNPNADKFKNEKPMAQKHVDVKILTVPCEFQGGAKSNVNFYIGNPDPKNNPIKNQAHWLSTSRGGTPPEAIMNSLETLHKIAQKNNIPLGDLCEYAIKSVSPTISTTTNATKKIEAEANTKTTEIKK